MVARLVLNHSTHVDGLMKQLVPALLKSPLLKLIVPGRIYPGSKSSSQESSGMRLKARVASNEGGSGAPNTAKYKTLFASASMVQEVFVVCHEGKLTSLPEFQSHMKEIFDRNKVNIRVETRAEEVNGMRDDLGGSKVRSVAEKVLKRGLDWL